MTKRDSVIIVAPFDASSRSAGASSGALAWLKLIKPIENLVFHSREKGDLLPYIVEHEVRKALSENRVPIVLGGDHSLTYHALVPICSYYGQINLVHFDAHHDAYAGCALNHYTVILSVLKRLPIKLFGVGYRHDSHMPARLQERVIGPAYISIDVDYFDDHLVSSVGHAVQSLAGENCNFESFTDSLDLIDGPILGGDIVEWYGSDNTDEQSLLKSVFQRLRGKVEC